jgi:hypothetical protein
VFGLFLGLGFRLRQNTQEEQGDQAAADRIGDEQGKERTRSHEAAHGGANDEGIVEDHTQDPVALLPFGFGKDIGQHRFMSRIRQADKESDEDYQWIHHLDAVCQAERETAQAAEHQPQEDQLFAAEFIGQRAAEHAAEQSKERVDAEQDSSLGHPYMEPLGDIQGEERPKNRPPQRIDKTCQDDEPEQRGKFVIDFLDVLENTFHGICLNFFGLGRPYRDFSMWLQ